MIPDQWWFHQWYSKYIEGNLHLHLLSPNLDNCVNTLPAIWWQSNVYTLVSKHTAGWENGKRCKVHPWWEHSGEWRWNSLCWHLYDMVLFLGCRKNPVPRWEACLEWQSMGGMSELQPVVVIFLAHGKPQWETCLEWQYKVMHQTDILVPIMLTPVVHTNYHPSTEFDTTPCHENECETMTDQNLFSPFPSPPAVRLGLNKI